MEESTRLLLRSPRVMVALYVPWSTLAVRSQSAFRAAAEAASSLGVEAVELNEDEESTGHWLASLGDKRLQAPCCMGAGTIIWLEHGRVVDYELNASPLSATDLTARTTALWGKDEA